MSRIKVSIRPATVSHEPVVRALAHFILAVSVLFIVFAALFPFDFDFPRTGLWDEVRRKFDSSPEPAVLRDRVQNFLFFVPLGFGLGASIRPRHGHGRRRANVAVRVIAGFVLGAALSLTVEVFQVFLGFRDPTWLDVVMNTLGSTAGAATAVFGGEQVLEAVARPLVRLKPFATLRNVSVVLVLYALAQLALPFRATNRGLLDNWDNGFPLLVGNEAGGGRAWNGRVWHVDLASRAAEADEVREMFAGGHGRLSDSLLASYRTIGDGPFEDATGLLKPLTWVGAAAPEVEAEPEPEPGAPPRAPATKPISSEPAHVTGERWLRTPTSLAPAVHRVRQSSQFTLTATVAPDEDFQDGPARVVSISGGIYRRNVSLMHERRDLVLRLRTPLLGDDGSAPEALVDDVFDSTDPKHVVVTYADPLLVVYVDGAERGRMEITPEAEFIWRMYPRSGWKVRLGRYGFRAYAVVYRLLVFIPFAALLAAATALSGRPWKVQLAVAAGAIVVVAVALEVVMGRLTASGFQPSNLVISLLIASVSLAAMRVRPRRRAHVASNVRR